MRNIIVAPHSVSYFPRLQVPELLLVVAGTEFIFDDFSCLIFLFRVDPAFRISILRCYIICLFHHSECCDLIIHRVSVFDLLVPRYALTLSFLFRPWMLADANSLDRIREWRTPCVQRNGTAITTFENALSDIVLWGDGFKVSCISSTLICKRAVDNGRRSMPLLLLDLVNEIYRLFSLVLQFLENVASTLELIHFLNSFQHASFVFTL